VIDLSHIWNVRKRGVRVGSNTLQISTTLCIGMLMWSPINDALRSNKLRLCRI
jgi:hypothetical protein